MEMRAVSPDITDAAASPNEIDSGFFTSFAAGATVSSAKVPIDDVEPKTSSPTPMLVTLEPISTTTPATSVPRDRGGPTEGEGWRGCR
jgi:hypothetical protein